jgi:RNA polymerase sigma factor (TIGR02999 family)
VTDRNPARAPTVRYPGEDMGASPAGEARPEQVTRLLQGGLEDERSREELLALVYDELRELARRRMSGERAGHTLEATALVHEAWMRLVASPSPDWHSRRHFYGAAAEAMRRVLVDHARRARSQKRGGERVRVTLGADLALELDPERFLSVVEALDRLAEEDPRAAEVTRLRFFSGLEMAELAAALGISERTAHREWTFARARLTELLADG